MTRGMSWDAPQQGQDVATCGVHPALGQGSPAGASGQARGMEILYQMWGFNMDKSKPLPLGWTKGLRNKCWGGFGRRLPGCWWDQREERLGAWLGCVERRKGEGNRLEQGRICWDVRKYSHWGGE